MTLASEVEEALYDVMPPPQVTTLTIPETINMTENSSPSSNSFD
jgi:hypothetical protein